MVNANLYDLDNRTEAFKKYISERHKFPVKKEVLQKRSPQKYKEFIIILRGLLVDFDYLEKNKIKLYILLEKLEPKKDKSAIKRYKQMIEDITPTIKNIKTHLSRLI